MTYETGESYFYKGKKVELKLKDVQVGGSKTGALIRRFSLGDTAVSHLGYYEDIVIEDITVLEPLAEHSFKLGATVVSTVGNSTREPLIATVIGFDKDTNQVLLKSNRLDNYKDQRVRYAYGPNELRLITDEDRKRTANELLLDSIAKINSRYRFSVTFSKVQNQRTFEVLIGKGKGLIYAMELATGHTLAIMTKEATLRNFAKDLVRELIGCSSSAPTVTVEEVV